jgi:hypothetical protein
MINLDASAPSPLSIPARKLSAGVSVLLFFTVGLLQTLLAYVIFSRADDHGFFLELANLGAAAIPESGQDLIDLKSKLSGTVYYLLTSPARWLGGHELVHLLWLRLLALWGFLAAFSWFQHILAPHISDTDRYFNRRAFMILVLIYPGQLAWTASLLRDGVGTALFLLGLYCLRRDWRIVPAGALFALSFALRPEYAIILILIIVALLAHWMIKPIKSRIVALLLMILVFSVATHPVQVQGALFAQFAFGDGDMAYPLVTHAFDLKGYVRILLQSLIDPIPLDAPQAVSGFGIIDASFFIYLLWRTRLLLRHPLTLVAALAGALLFGMWIFGYFEIFVSGFGRHRLCLEIALIALIAAVGRKNVLQGNRHEI